MTHVFDIVMVPLQIIIFLFTIYYFIIGFCGMWRRKENKILTPQKSFAVIVAAHNEKAVIGQLIANLQELEDHYARGGLGDVKVKKFLNNVMQEVLEPIRNRRKEFAKDIPAIYDMLKKGCDAAREVAAATLDDVRKAMKINYFDDAELIAEQVKKFSGE